MFTWRLLDALGEELGRSEPFTDRAAAESWLGGSWDHIAADGVAEVELIGDGGRPVYRMSLGPG